MKLKEKHERFAREYVIDYNATQAAVRAGYSEKTAKQTGSENLSKPDLKQYIDAELKKLGYPVRNWLQAKTRRRAAHILLMGGGT